MPPSDTVASSPWRCAGGFRLHPQASWLESVLPEHRTQADRGLSYNLPGGVGGRGWERAAAWCRGGAPRSVRGAARVRVRGDTEGRRGARAGGRLDFRPPPAQIDRAWAPPQPMSASWGGPWNQRLRLLKSRRLRSRKAERSWDCPGGSCVPARVDRQAHGHRAEHRTAPVRAGQNGAAAPRAARDPLATAASAAPMGTGRL